MKKLIALIFASTALASTAMSAPQGLYGKSVKVTWNETRSQRLVGEAVFKSISEPFGFVIYVSSRGTLFKRFTAVSASGNRSGKTEGVGASGGNSEGAASTSFSGNTITVAGSNFAVGRRIQITLDGSFMSCSAQVVTGKSKSGPATFRSRISGEMMELDSASAGAASCSVQEGNAFAN